jgi:hypothetical protein
MADNKGADMSENSPEHIAYRLLQEIAHAEDVQLLGQIGSKKAHRNYILLTYDECLHVVKGNGVRKK